MSQTFVVDHIAGLLDRGHRVTVVPLTFSGAATDAAMSEAWRDVSARTRALPDAPTGSRLARTLTMAGWMARHTGVRAFLRRGPSGQLEERGARLAVATRVATAQPFDVLHAQFGPAAITAVEMRRSGVFDAPIVVSFHGFDVSSYPLANPGCYDCIVDSVRFATAGTQFMRAEVERLGIPAAALRIWPQGVDTDRFTPAPPRAPRAEFRVVVVARLVDFKGVDVALRTIALARAHIPGLRVVIAGDGERRAALEALAKELGVDDITTWLGAVAHDVVVAEMSDADVFLLTGRTDAEGHVEGQGVAVLEASALGLPVVVTRSGGLAEVVDPDETGLVVPPEQPQLAADALVRLANDPALRTRLGSNGRAFVEARYSRTASIDAIEAVYRECV